MKQRKWLSTLIVGTLMTWMVRRLMSRRSPWEKFKGRVKGKPMRMGNQMMSWAMKQHFKRRFAR
ncbi:hypothetical protein [Mechercharimyces sp. CAU 1602]|uniref:hypothetical protein n=1 Tax=Mechercharimyces sp. CAU 1602 TaxID=2973933 RepID=UPI002161535D|nr:hypothetical protein [Mechercharimyces sp. CAU 1602]MCS1350258.1 hypothetical protein [Mechercharimyces sp. CAU 1602]